MPLTVFPTITFNSGSGTDTQASGAGSTLAISGTAAAAGTTSVSVTISGTTLAPLSAGATDGSAVMWISGIGFARIDTHNSVDTIVVERPITCTGQSFYIGGKRATLDNADSRYLFAATVSPTGPFGISGNWNIQLEDDQTITSAITLTANSGLFNYATIKGNASPARRKITQSTASAFLFNQTVNSYWHFDSLEFNHSNATKNYVIQSTTTRQVSFSNCIAGNSAGLSCPSGLMNRAGNVPSVILYNSSVLNCRSSAMANNINLHSFGSEISKSVGSGVPNASIVNLYQSIISYNGGDGIVSSSSIVNNENFVNNTIVGNTGNGFTIGGGNLQRNAFIAGNIFASNSFYGINFSGSSAQSYPTIQYNDFFSNGSGTVNGITFDSTNLSATDPQFTNGVSGTRDFSIGTNLRGLGFPGTASTVGANTSSTTTYFDIGASQRQIITGAASSGARTHPGMNAGVNS